LTSSTSLKELALLFLKLGIIGFGGPAVHIAMMEEEVVRKRKWLDQQQFLDLVGATNLIPGPNSTEMTMHIGRERAGWKGLIVAGCCFILPAVIITGFFSWAYQLYGQLPAVEKYIYGIKPAILSIVVAAIFPLARKSAKSKKLILLGLTAMVLVLLGVHEIIVLFGSGFFAMLLQYKNRMNGLLPFFFLQAIEFHSLPATKLFWIFLKIGAVLYGSGYVLFSFLDAAFVQNGLLDKTVLVDAIAVGQFTPGPVFSSATFIGWQLGGIGGAIASTIGIFLPSFLFVALLNPLIPMLRKSVYMSAFLDAVNIVAVVIIFVLMFELGVESIYDWRTILIAALSFIFAFRFRKINSAFIVFGGAALGYLLWWL
jgi:chromate transporter